MEKEIKEIYEEHIEKISDKYLDDSDDFTRDHTGLKEYSPTAISESVEYAKDTLKGDNNPYFEEFLDDINEQAYPEKEYTSEEVLKIVGNFNK